MCSADGLRTTRDGCPESAEEALLSLQSGQALFLVGGFGGCTRDIAETLELVEPRAGSDARWPGRQAFEQWGVGDLHNGLSNEENRLLARTPYVQEAVDLVLRGIGSLGKSRTNRGRSQILRELEEGGSDQMNAGHTQGEVNTTTRNPNAPDVSPSYKNNWKYKTCSDHTYCLDASTTKVVEAVLEALSEEQLETKYYTLTPDCLTIKEEYAWDGASGPTIDSRTSMRASPYP